jgi:cell wall-associated NlpC family hydrolase
MEKLNFDKRITPFREDIAADFLQGKVIAAQYKSPHYFMITSSVCDLCDSIDGKTQSQLIYGEIFIVYEQKNGWCWGQSNSDNYVGYISDNHLQQIEYDLYQPTHKVNSLQTFIYEEANIKSKPIKYLPYLAVVEIEEEFDQFYKLKNGYIYKKHLIELDSYSIDPVNIAKKLIARPYLWGGKSSFALDCSAFMQIIFAACGIFIPRDSDMQEAFFQPVEREKKRGDLVFWKGHVGIMTNDIDFIHANAYFMQVTEEPFLEVINRSDKPISSIRCLPRQYQEHIINLK